MYNKPNLVSTFIEVTVNSAEEFSSQLRQAADENGVGVTSYSQAFPADDKANEGQSKYFMTLTGNADKGTGKPSAQQLDVLSQFKAKNYGTDQEAWEINKRIATDTLKGHDTKPSTDSFSGYAQPVYE